jgi:hypothetical protein
MKRTTTQSPPPAKGNNKFVDLADTDGEDSASSPDDDGPHVHISQGVDYASPPSVIMKVKMSMQLGADSCYQLPSLVLGEGTAKDIKWSIRVQAQDQHKGKIRKGVA